MAWIDRIEPGKSDEARNPKNKRKESLVVRLLSWISSFLRNFAFQILAAGPLPKHVAIIMDGNRRYAQRKRVDRQVGHLHGYDRLIDILDMCMSLHVKYLTVYAFSIDNFKRSAEEVAALMGLLEEKLLYLSQQESLVAELGIRVCILGNLSLLPKPVQIAAKQVMEATCHHDKAVFNLCVSYTGREEITHAIQEVRDGPYVSLPASTAPPRSHGIDPAKRPIQFPAGPIPSSEIPAGKMALPFTSAISEGDLESHLYTHEMPPVDLLIRTSGETRLSNFLLWQCSHAVLVFSPVLWPNFSFCHMVQAVMQFQRAWPTVLRQRQLYCHLREEKLKGGLRGHDRMISLGEGSLSGSESLTLKED